MNTEEDMKAEENRNTEETTHDFEVGYGKPPKHTRFKKGKSGNPTGRPKKAQDFDAALLREARSPITINENGRQVRLSKHDVIIKQLINNAMKGKNSDLRMFREAYREACEKAALLPTANALSGKRAEELTDDQLEWIAAQGLNDKDKKKK